MTFSRNAPGGARRVGIWARMSSSLLSTTASTQRRSVNCTSGGTGAALATLVLALLCSATVIGNQRSWAATLPGDDLCTGAITSAEPNAHLPEHLLLAIGQVESGRPVPGAGTLAPWPWTINVNGVGRIFDTKEQAIAAVREARQGGIQSIDVGCMQINLLYHPQAFATLDDAFDPALNVAYAVHFLRALYSQTGDWGAAVAAYHSATPEIGLAYTRRVADAWSEALPFRYAAGARSQVMTSAALAAEVDPNSTLTPAFRAEMIAAAAFRHQHEKSVVDTGLVPLHADPPLRRCDLGGGGRRGAPTTRALEDEVDPKRVLTPQFRAEMVAAAASRHQHENMSGISRPDASRPNPSCSANSRFALTDLH